MIGKLGLGCLTTVGVILAVGLYSLSEGGPSCCPTSRRARNRDVDAPGYLLTVQGTEGADWAR